MRRMTWVPFLAGTMLLSGGCGSTLVEPPPEAGHAQSLAAPPAEFRAARIHVDLERAAGQLALTIRAYSPDGIVAAEDLRSAAWRLVPALEAPAGSVQRAGSAGRISGNPE